MGGEETEFKMDIIKCFRTPLERQVREGVEIASATANLNSKLDNFQPGMRRITLGIFMKSSGLKNCVVRISIV